MGPFATAKQVPVRATKVNGSLVQPVFNVSAALGPKTINLLLELIAQHSKVRAQ